MTLGEVELTQDLRNITYINDDDPGKKVSSWLFEAFSEALKQSSAPHQAMALLQNYESACEEQFEMLQTLCHGLVRNESKFNKTLSTYKALKFEKETWTLFHCLYKDRLEMEERENEMMEDDVNKENNKTAVWALSEQNIVNRLFERDSLVRQSQLVVDWLETCSDVSSYGEKAKFFIEQPVAWENTLHNLQKQKQGVKSSMSRCITEMDPDAPCRQKLSPDDLDQEDEKYFLRNLFMLVRAGKLEKAQNLCQACGQPWRAASLEGWRLFHDPNYYSSTNIGDVRAIEGNPQRDIWKSVCWGLANEPSLDQYERAVYAALSGNLQAVLPVCNSWMDYLWAYFKVMVDTKVEQEVRLLRTVDRKLDSLPSDFEEIELDPHRIFKDIAASIDENVRLQSENSYHVIQKYVILGDIPALVEVMYNWVQSSKNNLPDHMVRLMAHIVLFLRSIGHACKEELCEAILEAFVENLIKNKHKDIVAHYVSSLSPSAQVQWYATFLEDIEGQEERQKHLQKAEEEGLNVALITKTVVERIRARDSDSFFPETSLASDLVITEEDTAKINAIDWLVFDEAHRPEALKQANAIMRSFIVVKKHAAARQVFEKLPSDTVDVIYRTWYHKTGSGELLPCDHNAIREYLCMKSYLDAVESFNDWFNLFHKDQPTKPGGVEAGASFTDRVAFEHKLKQYNLERERWMHNLLVQTRTTRDRIYNVLLFADGGWLIDAVEDPDSDESRQLQMSQLRKLHLPNLCLNLHTVLHSSRLYPEAVQIADVVASESHQLYKDFDKEAMQHLLAQISRSSACLLDENKDPLGYDMV
ncbi:nuclear pore complex protein Nup107-like [Elysia marginata]|uniref:Nuclear pore complex protein n=1 Tax=Elysia marginata TaxID=1093978 RepID=A0AAV4GV96_9GAST|nr:nuclear pore complex protein Nup107-like [Elysia marginata]